MGVVSRVIRAVAAVSLLGGLIVAVAPPAGAAATCFGLSVTIQAVPGQVTFGTAGADVIRGTAGPDEIYAGSGDDRVCSRGGDDLVLGQGGDDRINLGSGDDEGLGGKGDDLIQGKKGQDEIRGNSGSDTLAGGPAGDQIWGGSGDDVLMGKTGHDVMYGGRGNDELYGNQGNDTLFGGKKGDLIRGGKDDDTLWGNSGPDTLIGDTGSDQCSGGKGTDTFATCEAEPIPSGATCAVDLDLTTWQEALYDNAWTVTSGRADHLENGRPTMLISPDGLACQSVSFSGTLRVEGSDRDWIGFGLGVSKPTTNCTVDCPVEGVFVTWKSLSQAFPCDLANPTPEGWSVRQIQAIVDVKGFVSSSCEHVFPVFADSVTSDPRVQVLASGLGTGWALNTTYDYTVEYSTTNVRVLIDNVEVLDLAGTFPLGTIGFYNLSQAGAQYTIDSFVGN